MPSPAAVAALAGALLWNAVVAVGEKGVRVVADEAQRRVDITIDGQPFTSYLWPTSLKKPVLYPLVTDEGIPVTRGYPLDPRRLQPLHRSLHERGRYPDRPESHLRRSDPESYGRRKTL